MKNNLKLNALCSPVLLAASLGLLPVLGSVAQAEDAFLPRAVNSSTIPANGDLNPYGVAFVPKGFPSGSHIAAGDILVGNFNAASNKQGTGISIVRLRPHGPIAAPTTAETFFLSPLVGLSTALGALRGGFVVVGNLPTTDGTSATISAGALQVIDRHGVVNQTWPDPNGPWDLAIDDHGSAASIFVSEVLTGTVVRIDVDVSSKGVSLDKKTTIATGYAHRFDPAALVLGPTGLAYDRETDTLFVASTADNAIYSIDHAAHRTTAVVKGNVAFLDQHLRGPLALRFAPNGNLLAANGDAVNADPLHPSEMVEFTRWGQFVREYNVDASPGGAFGFDTRLNEDADDDDDDGGHRHGGVNLALVDDVTNNLWAIHLPVH